jgi:predicted small secreted protein
MLKKAFLAVLLIAVMCLFIGCQTVQGLGQDITWVGEKGAEVVER